MVPVGEKSDAYKMRSVHLTETDHVSHLGTDGKLVSKRIKKMGSDGVEWILLDRNKDQWRALVNKVAILGVLQNAEDFLKR